MSKKKDEDKKWNGKNRREKRLSGRKIFVFVVNCLNLDAIYFISLFKAPEVATVIGVTVIIGHIVNGAILVGGNTLDKIANFKFFKG